MYFIENGILSNGTSVFMCIRCTADNLQLKIFGELFGEKEVCRYVQITFRKSAAGACQEGGGPGCGVREVAWMTAHVEMEPGCSGRLFCATPMAAWVPRVLQVVWSLAPGSKSHRYLDIGFRSEPIWVCRLSHCGLKPLWATKAAIGNWWIQARIVKKLLVTLSKGEASPGKWSYLCS